MLFEGGSHCLLQFDLCACVAIRMCVIMFPDCSGIQNSLFCFSLSGHLMAPVIAHAFCNHMGFPAFNEVMGYPQPTRSKLIALFVIGLVLWMFLLFPLTTPWLYSNYVYTEWSWLLFLVSQSLLLFLCGPFFFFKQGAKLIEQVYILFNTSHVKGSVCFC